MAKNFIKSKWKEVAAILLSLYFSWDYAMEALSFGKSETAPHVLWVMTNAIVWMTDLIFCLYCSAKDRSKASSNVAYFLLCISCALLMVSNIMFQYERYMEGKTLLREVLGGIASIMGWFCIVYYAVRNGREFVSRIWNPVVRQ